MKTPPIRGTRPILWDLELLYQEPNKWEDKEGEECLLAAKARIETCETPYQFTRKEIRPISP